MLSKKNIKKVEKIEKVNNVEEFEEFDFAELKKFKKQDMQNKEDDEKENIELQKKYIIKHFFPLNDGYHARRLKSSFEILDESTLKKVYFNRFGPALTKYYFKTFDDIKTLECKLYGPIITKKTVNISHRIKATQKDIKEFSKETIQKTETVFKYIEEVLANNKKDSYDYILDWLSYMLKGGKNKTCIYLKGAQGIGKSTITEFLKEHVIGHDLSLECSAQPFIDKFNGILKGKLLVTVTEFQVMMNDWLKFSSNIKTNISGKTFTIEHKGKDSFQINNSNNYFMDSNFDIVKDDEGRRFYIADVNHSYADNKEYWNNLRKSFTDDVGDCFYSILMNRDTSNYDCTKYPDTESKLLSHAKRLDTVKQFLKYEYVLMNQKISYVKPKIFYDLYISYCVNNKLNHLQKKEEFFEKLKQINIEVKKSNGIMCFNEKQSFLQAIADKERWITKYDEYEDKKKPHSLDFIDDDKDEEITKLKDDEINKLKSKVEELEQLILNMKKEKVTVNKKSPLDFIDDDDETTRSDMSVDGDEDSDEEIKEEIIGKDLFEEMFNKKE